MKNSIVKEVRPNGQYEGSHGILYKYWVELENGDNGEYSSKSQTQSKIVVGQNLEYDLDLTYPKYPKIKPVTQGQANFSGGGSGNGSNSNYKGAPKQPYPTFEERAIGMAMGYAKDLLIAEVFKGENLEAQFKRIHKMMIDLKEDLAAPKQAPPPDQFQQFSNQGDDPRDTDFPPPPEEPYR